MTTSRALLIGVDGLDFDMLGRFTNDQLPNIMGIIETGASARSKSVLPINSAAAWTSILTGMNPGAHGVYGFRRTHPDGYTRSTVGCGDIGSATLWEMANHCGAPAGLINCPMTYPPPRLKGFVVSGIPIPYNNLWAYPPEAEQKLEDRFGPYTVDLSWWNLGDGVPGRRETFLADMYRMTRKREEVALWTMANLEWRIMAVIFTGTDRLLHSFWHLSDPGHPAYDEAGAKAYGRQIHRYFILLDDIIGRIMETAGDDVPVILASDHGFGPCHYRFHLRKWLLDKKFMAEIQGDNGAPGDWRLDEPLRSIDWGRTVAYPASISESGVIINLKGRQGRGIVALEDYENLRERISRGLCEISHGGARVVEKVYRREDVLSGPCLEEAPDLLIAPAGKFIVDDTASDEVIEPSARETACHRSYGVFAGRGPGFKKGFRGREICVMDVLPTILAASGLPIPGGLDGEPVMEAFLSPPSLKRCNIELTRKRRSPGADIENEEEEAMKRQLKGIGYL